MPDNYPSERAALTDTLTRALQDSPAGEQATAQSDSQIEHPHRHAGQTSGPTHVDGLVGTKMADGSVKIEKIHSDDD